MLGSRSQPWEDERCIPWKVRYMAGKPRYTAGQMIEALKATKGMIYLAAQRLQCDHQTVLNYCKRYPTVEQTKQGSRGELLDVAELKLWQAVQRGEAWAIAFTLKTIGKSRGYVERQEVTGQDGAQPWQVNVVYLPSKSPSPEQWALDVKELRAPYENGQHGPDSNGI
jgi:hypothetical protein